MRKTKIRSELLTFFEKDASPISVNELLSNLFQVKPNKTTIYRELQFLKESGIIREVLWDDSVVRYEKFDPNCHHHTVCKSCGKVEPIHVDELALISLVEAQSNFQVQKHIIEFFGLCKECR